MPPLPDATEGLPFASPFSPGCWLAIQYCLHFSTTSFGKTIPASKQARIPRAAYWEFELSLRSAGPSFFFVSRILFTTFGFSLESLTSTGLALPPADATSLGGIL